VLKTLITGSNSFIGTNFRKFSHFDIIDEVSLIEVQPEDIDFKKYDVVLHLAAIVHNKKKIPESDYLKINCDLCLRVAENAKKSGISHFIFMSTVKVYGNPGIDGQVRNEESECFPDDAYGRSKYEAEIGLRELEDYNFTVSIIRTPLVYGFGVKANMMSLIKLVKFVPVLPFGGISNKRNFTYIENLVGFIDRIIDKRASGTFIAMDENSVSTTELVNYLSKFFGKRTILIRLPGIFMKMGKWLVPEVFERLFDSLEFDNNNTKNQLDYRPPFTTEEGIRKMFELYRSKLDS
jgi:nucleoside-diphosphate-sugar epimerase